MMNEVTLNPASWGAQQIILQAVNANIDSPVQYAFADGFPVALSVIEAEEVYEAVEMYQPPITQPHAAEHKEIALDAIDEAQFQAEPEMDASLINQVKKQ